jgi:hypothetical protein
MVPRGLPICVDTEVDDVPVYPARVAGIRMVQPQVPHGLKVFITRLDGKDASSLLTISDVAAAELEKD